MKRRRFILGAASSLFVPSGLLLAASGVHFGPSARTDMFFYDERFTLARRLAASRSGIRVSHPIRGDVSAVWDERLRRACEASSLSLEGVTTESFHFCLEQLVRSLTRSHSRIERIGRELHVWTIRTDNDRHGVTGL